MDSGGPDGGMSLPALLYPGVSRHEPSVHRGVGVWWLCVSEVLREGETRTFDFYRWENVLKTKAHKGSQDNLGKTKDCCEFCHEHLE